MIKRYIDYRSLSRELGERLSRYMHESLVLVGVTKEAQFWYNDITRTFYREDLCNGPSSWFIGEAVGK